MPRRRADYVFVDDVNCLELRLIETSVRANEIIEHMQHYRSSLVYPNEGMCSLLKMLKSASMFNEIERRKIINKMHKFPKDEECHLVAKA